MMSSGLGLRNTAKGIDVVPCPPLNALMFSGRRQSVTRGCSEWRGSKYRDLSVGGKESSTNSILV